MDKPTIINNTTINNYGNANANDVDNSVNVNPDLDQIADKVKQLEDEVKHSYTKLAVAVIGMLTVLISSLLNPSLIKIIIDYLGL